MDPARGEAETERRLRALIDHMPAMIGYWDRELRNVMANEAYVEWFGVSPEQMLGRHISEVIGPDLYAKNRQHMTAALAGEEQHFDRTIVDASGRTRYSQASYIPDVAADGTVHGFFVLVADVTARVHAEQELAAAKEELEVRATTDPLTSLANRTKLEQRVELALAGLERAEPGTRAMVLMMLDLDGFKAINDSLGHAVGDELLTALARRLRHEVREPDLVARLGGDEFVVLLAGLSCVPQATVVADRVVHLVREPVVLATHASEPLRVTSSVGVVVGLAGQQGLTYRSLLTEADRLMYLAKSRGGDQWAMEVDVPHPRAPSRGAGPAVRR